MKHSAASDLMQMCLYDRALLGLALLHYCLPLLRDCAFWLFMLHNFRPGN